MKIQATHLKRLKEGYQKAIANREQEAIEKYQAGKFSNAANTKDLQSRFVWDVFHCITHNDKTLLNELYTYLEDQHIFAALKSIVPSIQRNY